MDIHLDVCPFLSDGAATAGSRLPVLQADASDDLGLYAGVIVGALAFPGGTHSAARATR
jgi:hypothetical protein